MNVKTLIIGGAGQGKLDFAKKKYNLNIKDIAVFEDNYSDCSINEKTKVIYGFHVLVRKWLNEGRNPIDETKNLNVQIIISDEIGNGIIPIDKFERRWREEVGKCCCFLAGDSECVIRVYCGIGTVIK